MQGMKTLLLIDENVPTKPSIIFSSVDINFESYKDINAKVSYTGLVDWNTPVILKCTCNIDARLYPFDVQVCELKFSAWAYDGAEVDLVQIVGPVSTQNQFRDDSVWELIKVDVVRREVLYACCTTPFPDLGYFIHLRRRSLFHVLNIIIPCLLLSVLNLMVFVLPPESGEKIQLGMTNLLALVLFQQLITDNLPPTSADKSPIISKYEFPTIPHLALSLLPFRAGVPGKSLSAGDSVPVWKINDGRNEDESKEGAIKISLYTVCRITHIISGGTESSATPLPYPPIPRRARAVHY